MYQIPQLLKYKYLFHAFSQKDDGNMANFILGNDHFFKHAVDNRKTFFNRLNININKSICMWVVHGNQVIMPSEESEGVSMLDYNYAVKVDGLISNKKGIYLFLLIADCLPIILYDPIKEVVGLIHAGWRGVDLEIVKKAVLQFKTKFKSKMEDLIVGIGPCAYKESFVKENPSQKDDPRWKDFIKPVSLERSLAQLDEVIESDRSFDGILSYAYRSSFGFAQDSFQDDKEKYYHVDLVGFIKRQLIDTGVKAENIFESEIDTVKDKQFFSYVRECNLPIEKQGRFCCVVGIK